jgi:hypothetical protein
MDVKANGQWRTASCSRATRHRGFCATKNAELRDARSRTRQWGDMEKPQPLRFRSNRRTSQSLTASPDKLNDFQRRSASLPTDPYIPAKSYTVHFPTARTSRIIRTKGAESYSDAVLFGKIST